MEKRLVRGYYFEIGKNHYYFFPGILNVAFSEEPLYMEMSTSPNALEKLVIDLLNLKLRKTVEEDKNIRHLKVQLSLVKEIERAFAEKDIGKVLLTLRRIEKYRIR